MLKLVSRRRSGSLCSLPVNRLGTDGQMCSAKCAVCSAHSTLSIVQIVVYIVLYAVCKIQCSVLCVMRHFKFAVQGVRCSVQSMVCSVHIYLGRGDISGCLGKLNIYIHA